MTIRLLPKNKELGWTPFMLLIWSVPFLIVPIVSEAGGLELLATGLGYLVFLVLHFRGFWLRGRRLLPIIAGLVALALIFSPFNLGASTFFVYAGSFAGEAGRPRFAYGILALIVLAAGLQGVLTQSPFVSYLPAIVITLVIGAMMIHDSQVRRRNARLRLAHEDVEKMAKLDERERIARDLHDLLGHSLSVINLKSQLAARLVETDPERAAEEMRDVEGVSREVMEEVRRAVSGYREQKLGSELAKARVALEAAVIELELITCPYDLSAEKESVLALALREAVTNVLKHSDATKCRIELSLRDDEVWLTVEDDGRGFGKPGPDADRAPFRGSGLEGMRQRLESFDGTLVVSLREDNRRGTVLHARLPMTDAASRATSVG